MKIVINNDYGGFGLSEEAYKALGIPWDGYGFAFDDDRANPKLIKVVEELGERVNGGCANLKVVEIPDGVSYDIAEYDGWEHIAEKHRTWR